MYMFTCFIKSYKSVLPSKSGPCDYPYKRLVFFWFFGGFFRVFFCCCAISVYLVIYAWVYTTMFLTVFIIMWPNWPISMHFIEPKVVILLCRSLLYLCLLYILTFTSKFTFTFMLLLVCNLYTWSSNYLHQFYWPYRNPCCDLFIKQYHVLDSLLSFYI